MRRDLFHEAKLVGLGIVIGALTIILTCVWLGFKPAVLATLAPTSPKLDGISTETKKCDTVQAYKEPAKKKLGLPAHVQKDSQAVPIAAAPVPPSDYPRTATALLHLDTGVGEIYLQQDPLPWVAFNQRATLGVAYGLKDDTEGFVTRVYGKLDLAQIKALHLGLRGDVDSTGDWYLGAFAEGRFKLPAH